GVPSDRRGCGDRWRSPRIPGGKDGKARSRSILGQPCGQRRGSDSAPVDVSAQGEANAVGHPKQEPSGEIRGKGERELEQQSDAERRLLDGPPRERGAGEPAFQELLQREPER